MEGEKLLHRQIHPSFVVNDIVSNQAFIEISLIVSSGAFNPTEKDKSKLSVYNGNKFSAKEAYEHFTTNYTSYGVLSLNEEEVLSVDTLNIIDDDIPFEGHSYIDFSQVVSKNQKTKKASKLRDFAVKRSWTYRSV